MEQLLTVANQYGIEVRSHHVEGVRRPKNRKRPYPKAH